MIKSKNYGRFEVVPQLYWGTPSNPYKKQNVLG
jgi:hypothetical protein